MKQSEAACNEVGSTDLLCAGDRHPEHRTDGTPCWCEPEIYDIDGVKITIHIEVH